MGRLQEQEEFRKALHERPPSSTVLFVHGPGGVGKTALLAVFAELAAEAGRPVVRVDGRTVRAVSHGISGAVGNASPGLVLLLDTYELLEPVDEWLRETYLPALPADALVVVAGRNPPSPGWVADPGWRSLLRVLPLRNLPPAESREFLAARGVPDDRQEAAVAFTHGHPLALALVAGAGPAPFRPGQEPDLVRVLLSRFVDQVPGPRHRAALEAAAHLRVTTEELLADTLGGDDVPALFDWLRGLPFVEQGPHGLYPHDLARQVLDADLRWRSPDGYRRLHRASRAALIRRVQRTQGAAQREAIYDVLFLHRSSPVLGAHYRWESLGQATAGPVTARERDPIFALVERHEGADSARIARHWYGRQPAAFSAYHDEDGAFFGFDATLDLHEAGEEDLAADPAARAAVDVARRYGPTRAGEEMIYHRFFLGRDTYQDISSATNLFATACCRHWVTRPRLAWSFLAVADPDAYHALFTHMNLRLQPEAAFTVGGRRYGVYTHDWRAEPLLRWYEVMADRELGEAAPDAGGSTVDTPALVVLSQPEFRAAVRRALRDYTRGDALAANPLSRSRVVVERSGDLRTVLREAAESLRGSPRDEKLYRAVHRTYLEPAATQELAAERLELPFSTYRAHLTAGIERIAEWLWHREMSGS
ncbi:hypothetical protein [Phytohabitans houttuyneae]|uniref:Orc1-like AAA ATPase domain-containing protein n=1 Tax=Phytohabitans houttuyneae TaxID=1076126 RepID=A0A6V8K745_9ACTN|nr:hypothetical protein [Phytohabitans houttuyneae]GFJ77567.1 hypothetical protein Phou_017470 [Phytohabitans houttuyneae]